MKFEGKTVVVTGGANGIGRGIARAFCEAGAHVVVADIDAEGGNALIGALADAGLDCAFVPIDVSKEEDCRALAENAAKKYGKIDALINNAHRWTTPACRGSTACWPSTCGALLCAPSSARRACKREGPS